MVRMSKRGGRRSHNTMKHTTRGNDGYRQKFAPMDYYPMNYPMNYASANILSLSDEIPLDSTSTSDPPPSKKTRRNEYMNLDYETIWKPMLKQLYESNTHLKSWKDINAFQKEYLNQHHAELIARKKGCYPTRKTVRVRMEQYEEEKVTSERDELLERAMKHSSKTSMFHVTNPNRIIYDENNEPCALFQCGHVKPFFLLDAKNKCGVSLVPDQYKNAENRCPDCLAQDQCKRLQALADKEIKAFLEITNHSTRIEWKNGKKKAIDMSAIIMKKLEVPTALQDDPDLNKVLKVIDLEIPPYVDGISNDKEAKSVSDKIKGGFCPETLNLNKFKKLKLPTGKQIGVLRYLIKGEWNFVIFDRSYLDEKSTVEIARLGNRYKLRRCRFGRSGAAGGIGGPPYDERYDWCKYSAATKTCLRVHVPNSSGFYTVYCSLNPKDPKHPIVEFTPRRDIAGRKFSKCQRTQYLFCYEALRKMAICKLKSRIRSMAIIESLGMDDIDDIWTDLSKAMKDGAKPAIIKKWRSIDKSLSALDIALLEWASQSEETWNFMAVACHKDGDNRNFESMMLFGLVEENDHRSPERIMEEMTPGFTIFPMQGFAAYNQPGTTVLHVKANRSYHASDPTRNTGNFVVLTDYERRTLGAAAVAAGIRN